MSETRVRPSIYDYRSIQDFLTDSFLFARQEQTELTATQWSKNFGFKNPEPFNQVLKRTQLLKLSVAKLIAPKLSLNTEEQLFFLALTQFQYLRTNEEKELQLAFLDTFARAHRKIAAVVVSDAPFLFGSWLDSAILEFNRNNELKGDALEMSRQFRGNVEAERIEGRIEKLQKTGLLESKKAVTTINENPNPSLHQYYKEVSQLAADSTDVDISEREFQCFSMAIPFENLKEIKKMIVRFRDELSQFGGKKTANTLYHFNLQCFPLLKTERERENLMQKDA